MVECPSGRHHSLFMIVLNSSGSLSLPVGFPCTFHSFCFCGTLLGILESSLLSCSADVLLGKVLPGCRC